MFRLFTASSQSSSKILLKVYERAGDGVGSSHVRKALKQRKRCVIKDALAELVVAAEKLDILPGQMMPPLFLPPEAASPRPDSPVLDRLEALDPDALSPRDAHAALYELKRLAGD